MVFESKTNSTAARTQGKKPLRDTDLWTFGEHPAHELGRKPRSINVIDGERYGSTICEVYASKEEHLGVEERARYYLVKRTHGLSETRRLSCSACWLILWKVDVSNDVNQQAENCPRKQQRVILIEHTHLFTCYRDHGSDSLQASIRRQRTICSARPFGLPSLSDVTKYQLPTTAARSAALPPETRRCREAAARWRRFRNRPCC